ncbi:MAG: hypothetical protein EKK47_13895 [Burkholderiales bacterium]|nr:MAG: hypothetical protein EKK47_13895 [Burkholderiales bacterium]
MTDKVKRYRKPKEGDVFAIPLGELGYGFCQVCKTGDFAFFDLVSADIASIEHVLDKSIAFRVPAAGEPVREGAWSFLGNAPLRKGLDEPALYRNQPVGSNQVYIVKGNERFPASVDEAKDLEVMSWWFVNQLVERLQDYFAGRPNREFESTRLIKKYDLLTGQEIKVGS